MDGDTARELALQDGPLDYAALGFKCGLETHQQLASRKLFSPCPSGVIDPDAVADRAMARYDRRLRATQSELGEMDPAALAEAKKRRAFRYLAIDGLTSLVELDEEPPHPLCEEALDIALTFAGLLGSRPADEVHVMRKTVIDGSNTSGFQRTALLATGGTVDPGADGANGDDDVGIWTLALEEDSARRLEGDHGRVTYTLDRLGVPLIEVATAPDITDPDHAQRTAARLGALLRTTGRVMRGLGSIRQDLNVSIRDGDRVEIKGCQDLRAVPRVIEREVRRQLWLHHVAEELRARGFDPESLEDPVDVTDHFEACDSKVVRSSLGEGGKVLALVLPKWDGLIGGEGKDAPRLGQEFAAHAKVAAGVKGVFHSDELPAYGIGPAETEAVRKGLGLDPDSAFVLCVEKERVAREALEAVAARAASLLEGTGREVRAARPDDSTRYMRPLPGAARMYPETDVPPTRITQAHWKEVLERLPPRPEERIARLTEDHGLSKDQAAQLVREGRGGDFEHLVDGGVEAGLAARVLLQFLPEMADPDRLVPLLPDVAAALTEGRFAKEAVPDVLGALDKDPGLDVDGAIDAAGAGAVDESAIDAVIDAVVEERRDFIQERGAAAMGPLMGPVMAELRGKADGAVISGKLKAAIDRVLE